MLKPRDIAKVDFRVVWRGYNQDDVDEFVRKIVGAYEELYQQNLRLHEQSDELRARIDEYSQAETHIDETLALARQTSADVKAAAEERAKSIVAEAKARAEEIVRQARRQAEEHMARAQELTRQERAFRERFRDLLEAYWALLEEERRDAEQRTQSIMKVAGEVAAAQDGQDELSSTLRFDHPDEELDAPPFDAAPLYDDGDDDETFDSPYDPQPTRRMDAIDPERDG